MLDFQDLVLYRFSYPYMELPMQLNGLVSSGVSGSLDLLDTIHLMCLGSKTAFPYFLHIQETIRIRRLYSRTAFPLPAGHDSHKVFFYSRTAFPFPTGHDSLKVSLHQNYISFTYRTQFTSGVSTEELQELFSRAAFSLPTVQDTVQLRCLYSRTTFSFTYGTQST